MADYGLAAQIGRGGGNAMAPQQPDMTNRMMQILQLQQLQQNMMLAREQEGRQRELFPLSLEEKRADIRGAGARADLATTQGRAANIDLEEKQRAQRTYSGVLDVMDRVAKGTFNPANPASFRDLDPAVRLSVQDQFARAKKTLDEAEKAGLERGSVARAVTYDFLDRAGEGIVGPAQYQAALKKLFEVSPEAREFIPDNYNPDNAARLRDFVRAKKTSIQMVNGVPVMVTEGSPVAKEVGIVPFRPAAPPPAFGGLTSVQPNMPLSPELAARAGAGTPSDVGATQGIIGQRLPAAGEAKFTPAMPASQFVSEREAAKTATTRQEALPKLQTSYVSATEALDRQIRTIDRLLARKGSLDYAVGPIAGRSFSPTGLWGDVQAAQSEIDTVKSTAGLTALTELRQNSPTGGALGNVSNEEGRRLENSAAALSQLQNPSDFREKLATLRGDMERAKTRLSEAYKREHGDAPPSTTAPKDVQRPNDVTIIVPGGGEYRFPTKEAADKFFERVAR